MTQVLMQGVETFMKSLCHKKHYEEHNLRDLLCGTCDITRLPADHALR